MAAFALIGMLFFVYGWTYGRFAKTITSTNAAIAAITKTLGGPPR